MNETGYLDAIREGQAERLRRLVEAEPGLLAVRTAPLYAPNLDIGCTGLHLAVHADRPEAARVLVGAGIDLEAVTQEGRTALHDSIEYSRREITLLLLDRGAHVDVCSAAILGRMDRLRALLDEDPRRVNDRSTGLSPLGWASFGNQCDAARELIDRGAKMDDGELLCAASVGHVDVGRLLISRGADPNAIEAEAGGNALHAAASMKYARDALPFVEMLIEHGVDPHIPTVGGQTARQVAERRHREQQQCAASGEAFEEKPFEPIIERLRAYEAESGRSSS